MGRSRAALQKDKMRKRQQRLQVVEAFNYHPIDCLWKNEKVAELQTPFLEISARENMESYNSLPLTTPVAFRKIIGDGNCFFRCISYLITGGEENHRIFRQKICEYMESQSIIINSHLPNTHNNNVWNYLETTHMKQDSIWATEVEILAASMLLKTNIFIYTKHGVHWTWTRHTSQYTNTDKGIYLLHKDLNHFEVVVAVENSEIPVFITNDSQYYILEQTSKDSSFQNRLKTSQPKPDLKRNMKYRSRYRSEKSFRDKVKKRKCSKYKTNTVFRKMKKDRLKDIQKKKYETDLEFKRKKQMLSKLKQKHKFMTDPVYAHAKTESNRKYYRTRILCRERKKTSLMVKYSTNPMFRNRIISLSKQRYSNSKCYRENSKNRSREKYSYNSLHKEKMKCLSKKRYEENAAHREKVKRLSTKKYAEDPVHREKVKNLSRKQYVENSVHREKVKNFSRKKYASDSIHREKVKSFSRKKYANDSIHREKVKSFSRKKYAENVVQRQKVRQYSKNKYQRFASFRHNVKASSIKKYGSSPLFRSCIKRSLRDEYHSSKSIREKKKTRVYVSRQSIIKAIHKFKKTLSVSPKYICTVCIRILYRSQVKICNRKRYTSDGKLNKSAEECLTGLYVHTCDTNCENDCMMKDSDRDKEWICHNCDRYLTNDSMPPQSLKNNLLLPEIPEVLAKLNVLERQLIALRIPFMKLLSLPRGGQKGVKGPVVSVPTDLNTVCTSLPRNFSESQLIKVKLKRKLEYKGHYTYKWINPSNVLQALQDLLERNCWYDNIQLDKSWLENISESGLTEPDVDDSDSEEETSEQTEPSHTIPVDTCFQPIDIGQEMLDNNKTLCLAPAEHQKPQNIFQEDGADAMAFPVLLPDGRHGLSENRKIKLSPAKYFNARLFSADTRFSTDKEFIFLHNM